MNQTQRKSLTAQLMKLRDQKITQATVNFMNSSENRLLNIPQVLNHPLNKQVLALMGKSSEVIPKLPMEDIAQKIKESPYLNIYNIADFFNARNQNDIDAARIHNDKIKEREKNDLGAIKFRIGREYSDYLDSITLSTDFAASSAMVENFKTFNIT